MLNLLRATFCLLNIPPVGANQVGEVSTLDAQNLFRHAVNKAWSVGVKWAPISNMLEERYADPFSAKPLGRVNTRSEVPALIAVACAKTFRFACLLWAYSVLQYLPLPVFLFILNASSAALVLVLQRPFSSGKPINPHTWLRIARYSLLVGATSIVWGLGLITCGALRTVLLWDHSEVALLAAYGAIVSLGSHPKSRGTLFFILGFLTLLLFDNDQASAITEHPEGLHSNTVVHFLYWCLSFLGVPDHKGGAVLLIFGLGLSLVQKMMGRRLSVDMGGAKRLHALSLLVLSFLFAPWAFIHLLATTVDIPWSSCLLCVFCTSVTMVLEFYLEAIAVQRSDHFLTSKVGSFALFFGALVLSAGCWNWFPSCEHTFSAGLVIAVILLMVATAQLTQRTLQTQSLVGYSASGLPLYSSEETPPTVIHWASSVLHKILENSDSRRIFYFLVLNLAYTGVELLYGAWSNSLGLISDGFHMLFDCTALLVGLYASLMSRWKPTRIYSFGYGRVEVLSGFINGLFLVAIALMILAEAVERLVEPPAINTDRLLFVSVAGFIVNLIGVATFTHNHSHSHSHGGHGHTNANMQGVFLHVLADTLGSVGVIISSVLVEQLGWLAADAVCSVFIASMIIISVIPLLKESAHILLLATPNPEELHASLEKLRLLDGVLGYSDAHFWLLSSHGVAGTLHVQVAPSANQQKVIAMVTSFLKERGVTNLTVQVEKEEFLRANLCVSYSSLLSQGTHNHHHHHQTDCTNQIKRI